VYQQVPSLGKNPVAALRAIRRNGAKIEKIADEPVIRLSASGSIP